MAPRARSRCRTGHSCKHSMTTTPGAARRRRRCTEHPECAYLRSAQLAVLAPAAVVSGERGLVAVVRLLALQAQPHAGNRLAPRRRDLRTALRAVRQSG